MAGASGRLHEGLQGAAKEPLGFTQGNEAEVKSLGFLLSRISFPRRRYGDEKDPSGTTEPSPPEAEETSSGEPRYTEAPAQDV